MASGSMKGNVVGSAGPESGKGAPPTMSPEVMTLVAAIGPYSEWLAARNFAPKTRELYLGDLRGLVRYLSEPTTVGTVAEVTLAHLEGFLAHLDARRLAGATRRRKVAAIRS